MPSLKAETENIWRADELREFYLGNAKTAENSLPTALAEINGKSGAKFIVIMDEWSALFHEKKEDKALQEEYVQLLRGCSEAV